MLSYWYQCYARGFGQSIFQKKDIVIKSVFITGGTSGMGAELAKLYYEKSYRVGVCGRSKDKFNKYIGINEIEFYEVDVSKLEEISNAIHLFSKNGLDIVIANAGVGQSFKSSMPDFEDCRRVIDININGVINTFEAAISCMKNGGQLVAISSVASFYGLPGAGAYCASKAAVDTFCESLSLSLEKHGIDITTIFPGFIDTPLTQKNKHPMPFLQDSRTTVEAFYKAINKKKKRFLYPRVFAYSVLFSSYLPRCIYRFFIKRSSLNYTKTS